MRKASEVFGEWAIAGKDLGMEKGHAASVQEMMDFALSERISIGKKFRFLDFGCGNGWVARMAKENSLCIKSVGIDGAQPMISKAKSISKNVEYIHTDITDYNPSFKFDLIHSMEVMYYLSDPRFLLNKINEHWLKKDGRLIIGIDRYFENKASHSWEEKVGTPMLMLTEKEWVSLFNDASFRDIKFWRSHPSKDWAGTLVITGKKA